MPNTIYTQGTVSYFVLRDTSLFMTLKEEGAHGVMHKVKAYCPANLKDTPELWRSNFEHFEQGMRVVVNGSLSFDAETAKSAANGQYERVNHPVTGRDIYEPYIWAMGIHAIFDPAIHMKKRQQSDEHQMNAPAPSRLPSRPAVATDDDSLPPLPSAAPRSAFAWNSGSHE